MSVCSHPVFFMSPTLSGTSCSLFWIPMRNPDNVCSIGWLLHEVMSLDMRLPMCRNPENYWKPVLLTVPTLSFKMKKQPSIMLAGYSASQSCRKKQRALVCMVQKTKEPKPHRGSERLHKKSGPGPSVLGY